VNRQKLGPVAPALCIAIAGACCFTAHAGVAGPVNAFGLPHTALGQAQLSGSGGTLTISNIGSSGKDGVSIDLGGTQGFLCEVDFGQSLQLPPGMVYEFDGFSRQNSKCCIGVHEQGGGLAGLSVDVSDMNPGTLRVEALLDGQVQQVYEFAQPFPDPLVVLPLGTTPEGAPRLKISNIGSSGKDGVAAACDLCVDAFFDIGLPVDFQGSVGGNPPVLHDELRLSMLDLPPGTPVWPFTRVEMRASVPGSLHEFSIGDEAIELFGVPHRALGEAHMSASGGTLTVSNIGSSGKDGVRQDPLPPGTQGNLFEFADIQTATPSVLSVVSYLSLDGLPPGKPVTGSMYQDGVNPIELVVDFSAMGANTQTVELSLAGQLVFWQSGLAGVLASAPTPPDVCGTDRRNYVWVWTTPVAITISGGPTILGDELRVIPEAAGGLDLPGFQEITASQILVAGGDGTILLAGQQVGAAAAPCPWDCELVPNGDVGVTDFLAMLAQWGQTGASCDFDGGGVGVTDFLLMLGTWGPCP
jgi:hypothetical protein